MNHPETIAEAAIAEQNRQAAQSANTLDIISLENFKRIFGDRISVRAAVHKALQEEAV